MHKQIIDFWFKELKPENWFSKSDTIDSHIKKNFLSFLQQAVNAELFSWRNCAKGRLAEIIILDQFSRNIYRNNKLAFAQDSLALILSQEAIAHKADLELSATERLFLYLPFMHSESKIIHIKAEELFKNLGQQNSYEYELQHKVIIDRFGRYPHRNEILGRKSSTEELEFLKTVASRF